MHNAPGRGWSLASAVLGIVAGIVLLAWPLSGAVSLTMILTVFLVLEGVVSILYALEHKRELSGRWGVMLFSGGVDLLLRESYSRVCRVPRHGRSVCHRHQSRVWGQCPHRDGFARAQRRPVRKV
jgi:hypothetical protein